MILGEGLMRAAAWLSLVAWAAGEWLRHGVPDGRGPDRPARWAFSAGAAALLAHVAAAFQVRHGWSHAAAARHAAEQTEQVVGFAFGGAVVVNYLFLALWAAEAAWWWLKPASFEGRAAALDRSVRAVFLVMFANGAIVFVPGPMRWLGVSAVLAVLAAWYRGRSREARHV